MRPQDKQQSDIIKKKVFIVTPNAKSIKLGIIYEIVVYSVYMIGTVDKRY